MADAASPAPPIAHLPVQAGELGSHVAAGEPRVALDRLQRAREDDLGQGLPDASELAADIVVLVRGLPVDHRLVQPAPEQLHVDLAHTLVVEPVQLLVGRPPAEVAVGAGDVAVERDAHREDDASARQTTAPSCRTASVRPARSARPRARARAGRHRAGRRWPAWPCRKRSTAPAAGARALAQRALGELAARLDGVLAHRLQRPALHPRRRPHARELALQPVEPQLGAEREEDRRRPRVERRWPPRRRPCRARARARRAARARARPPSGTPAPVSRPTTSSRRAGARRSRAAAAPR